jgi:hypothetical protein
MRWISSDKIIEPVYTLNKLLKILEKSYVRIELSDRIFLQIIKEDSGNYYLESYSGSNDKKSEEFYSSDDLWRYVLDYLNYSNENYKSNKNIKPIECSRVFKLLFISALFQFFISIFMYMLGFIDYAFLVNIFGTLIVIATAFGVKQEMFFVQFGQSSRANAPFTFWSMATVGVIVGITVIVFSFMLRSST